MTEIKLASPDDAAVICQIRDEAWLDSYPNQDLGITKEQIRVNAQGKHGEFVPRRIACDPINSLSRQFVRI